MSTVASGYEVPVMLRRLLAPMVTLGLVLAAAPAQAATDLLRPKQWGLALIGAPEAWAAGRGAGTTIAVVDSGADLRHEDLLANLLPGRSFVSASPQDDDGHGSHVSGIAAGVADNGLGIAGVAPLAKLLPVKALGPDGGRSSDVAAGIRFAVDSGATVVNLSLGPDVPLVFSALDTSLADAIEYAWSKGVICVLAAGNNALPISDYGDLHAIVVTAVDRQDRKPSYATSVGAARWGLAAPGGAGPDGAGPDGAGPEDDIASTYWAKGEANRYEYLAGTSMATPHVAGAAAILRGLGLSAQDTVDRLLATAKDLGARGRDGTYGSGRLDLARAVDGLRRSAPAPSPVTAPTAVAGRPTAPVPAARPPAGAPAPTAAPAPGPVGPPTSDAADAEPVTTVAPTEPTPTDDQAEEDDNVVLAEPARTKRSDDSDLPIGPVLLGAGLVAAIGIAAALQRRRQRGA